MMKRFAVIMMLCAVVGMGWAVTPEQVGTFSGSIKIVNYSSTGKKNKEKADFQLEIAADGETTMSLGGSSTPSALSVYMSKTGFALFETFLGIQTVTLQFKNDTIKGVFHGAGPFFPDVTTIGDGKFKLKKVVP
jgi:hypothetical protein